MRLEELLLEEFVFLSLSEVLLELALSLLWFGSCGPWVRAVSARGGQRALGTPVLCQAGEDSMALASVKVGRGERRRWATVGLRDRSGAVLVPTEHAEFSFFATGSASGGGS